MALRVAAQTAPAVEDEAVGQSINYVFATDLGSGVYGLNGRTLQIYRFTYSKDLRESRDDRVGVRFTLPVTAGFFDFSPVDVISKGPPTRIDSASVVPGLELDIPLRNGWRLVPYARAGFSVASSSVDGWLYGTGLKARRTFEYRDWDVNQIGELAFAAVNYRSDTPSDRFVRFRSAHDFTRAIGREWRGRRLEFGAYEILDLIVDPPTAPLAGAGEEPVQLEAGMTLATRPRLKIWKFDAPRIGVGYRFAGDLSAWRIVIGVPF